MTTKYLVKFQNWDDPVLIETISENKTYNAARKSLNKHLKENGYLQTDDKWSQTYIRAGFIPGVNTHVYWIENEKGNKLPLNYKEENKVSAKTINNQQLTLFTNQQNQKTMPKGLVIGTTKDGKPVYGNATVSAVYRKNGSKNRKPSMNVPAQFVTLPSPFYTFGRKHLNEGKPNQRNFVIGATKSKNNRNIYVVAQLTYMGGKPAVTENRYKGYSRFTAWSVFNELPYHMKWIKDANNNWKETTGDGQTKTAVAEAIAIRKATAAARASKK